MINHSLYILLKTVSLIIVLLVMFTFFVGGMWNFSNLQWHDRLLSLLYLIVLSSFFFLRPQKNLVYFGLLLIGAAPLFYWAIKGFLKYRGLFDVAFPMAGILAFGTLLLLSFLQIK